MEYTLKIEHLKTQFHTAKGIAPAVDDVSLEIPKGKIIGLVGESGCGKSMTAMSIMQLVRKPGKIVDGKIMRMGRNLLDVYKRQELEPHQEPRGCGGCGRRDRGLCDLLRS